MIDVCTLVVSTVITLQGCMTAPRCEEANGKRYCLPAMVASCARPPPVYDCVRADGSHYQASILEHPMWSK